MKKCVVVRDELDGGEPGAAIWVWGSSAGAADGALCRANMLVNGDMGPAMRR